MGYRAHVNKKRIIEYSDNAYFNWNTQHLADYLHELKDDMYNYAIDNNIENMQDVCDYDPFIIKDGFGGIKDEWEIYRDWLEQAVLYLDVQILKGKGENIAFGDGDNAFTLEYVRNAFAHWLEETKDKENFSYPEFVYLTWF